MKARAIILAACNCVGIVAYLVLAARGWRDPAAAIPAAGEPFAWAVCLPVLFFFMVVDAAWAVLVARTRATSWLPLGIVLVLWICAVAFDFAHH
jgi:hypothetical protein